MLLTPNKSKCKIDAKTIVSKDTNSDRKHIAENINLNNVRQYQLDGDIIKYEKSCDFLVLNDDSKNAFFIELKGRNVSEAISQFEGAMLKIKSELSGYSLKFRIITSKSNTHEINGSKVIGFKKKYKTLIIKTKELKEKI